MRVAKRQWIYAGLSVPHGVLLVRRTEPLRGETPVRMMLFGDGAARGLAPPLGQLAVDAGAQLVARTRAAATVTDWAADERLRTELAEFQPTLALFALDPADRRSVSALCARARRAGVTPWWLPPRGREVAGVTVVPAPGEDLGALSARQYAAWAGSIWKRLAGGMTWAGS